MKKVEPETFKDIIKEDENKILNFFNQRTKGLPFSYFKIRYGYIRAFGEWNEITYNSPKMKLRVFKKLFNKN